MNRRLVWFLGGTTEQWDDVGWPLRITLGVHVRCKSPRSVQCEDIDRQSGMRLGIRYAVRLVVRRYGESASVDELRDATKESVVLEYANCGSSCWSWKLEAGRFKYYSRPGSCEMCCVCHIVWIGL